MAKLLVFTPALALALAIPAVASAQSAPQPGACPPGSWFCGEAPQQQAAPAGEPVPQQLQTLRLWLIGYEMEEIATRVGAANQRAAGNLLYRAIENLRYRFVGQSAP